MPEKIYRRFDGRDYYLDKVAATRRSADFAARLYRGKKFLARVTMIDDRRWGVWVHRKSDYLGNRVQLRNPQSGDYVLVDTERGKILEHSPTKFKNIRYVRNMSIRGDGDKNKTGGKK